MKIDVIIPLYQPGSELFLLLDRLKEQTVPVHQIILMNTERRYFEDLLRRTRIDIAKDYGNVQLYHIARADFDHGGTRHRAVQSSEADIFVLMTQDAMPADKYLIERLTRRLCAELENAAGVAGAQGEGMAETNEAGSRGTTAQGQIAVAYARQLPAQGSSETERAARNFNYPADSCVKTAADLEEMGVRTFFCSNVCAAYRRDIYEAFGGFVRHTIFNEDMIYAAGVIRAGYGIAYEAQACVVHSHQYTNLQQLKRNFDLGVSQADHPEVFAGVRSESEGKKLVVQTFQYLKKSGKLYQFPAFCVQCAFKYAGYRLGKKYRKLPERWVLALTADKAYWRRR